MDHLFALRLSRCAGNKVIPTIAGGSSGAGQQPCDISSTTRETLPTNRGRTTIGVGELVDLTTTGLGWTVTGDGALSIINSSAQATLEAGATSGTVTVSVRAKGTVCQANSLDFTVVAPQVTYINHNSIVGHQYGYASIAKSGEVYLGPSTVAFHGALFTEVQADFTANNAWDCRTGQPHAANPPPVLTAGDDTAPQGSFAGFDTADSGYCPNHYNQIMASSISVSIPTEYSVNGSPWYPINTVLEQMSEDAAGNLFLAKDQVNGQTAVYNATVTNY